VKPSRRRGRRGCGTAVRALSVRVVCNEALDTLG
jgi:hypothetical protein